MSTKLLLLRHAKSSWSLDGLVDSERPLNKRGKEASRIIGDYIAKRDLLPDVVVSSPALRARETLAGLDERWPDSVPVVFEPVIYGASASELLSCIQAQTKGVQTILVVGHNPGIESLALSLDPNGPDKLVGKITKNFPTCALAIFRCGDSWTRLLAGKTILEDFVEPKNFNLGA